MSHRALGPQFSEVERLDDIQLGDILRVSHPKTGGKIVEVPVEADINPDYPDAPARNRIKVYPEHPEGDWDFSDFTMPPGEHTHGLTVHSIRRPK